MYFSLALSTVCIYGTYFQNQKTMLLQIESPTLPETTPLYLCPTTEPREVNNKDGVLVTFGRHQVDVKVSSSPSVSRLHSVLRLVSYDEPKSSGTAESQPAPSISYLVLEDMGR